MKRTFKIACLLLVASAMSVASARATTFDFENVIDGGTVSYAGGTAPLIGNDILFDRLIVSGAPVNDGTYLCVGCLLDFTTGDHYFSNGSVEAWAGSGSFTLTGTVTTLGNVYVAGGANVNLLTGTWGTSGFVGSFGTSGSFSGGGSGTDQKDAALLAYFGVSNPFIYTNTELTASGCNNSLGGGTAFTCTVRDADLINRDVSSPESSYLLLLLGTAFVGIGHRRLLRGMKSSRSAQA